MSLLGELKKVHFLMLRFSQVRLMPKKVTKSSGIVIKMIQEEHLLYMYLYVEYMKL